MAHSLHALSRLITKAQRDGLASICAPSEADLRASWIQRHGSRLAARALPVVLVAAFMACATCVLGGSMNLWLLGLGGALVAFTVLLAVWAIPSLPSAQATAPLDARILYAPLPTHQHYMALRLLRSIQGAAAYHQSVLAHARPLYGFDLVLLQRVEASSPDRSLPQVH